MKHTLAPAPLMEMRIPGLIYLSGPMTGIPDFNFPAFNRAANELRAAGYQVVNPADHGVVEGAEWADYLRYDVALLARCDTIALLPGWSRSKGARLEKVIADQLGMRVMYLEGAEQTLEQHEALAAIHAEMDGQECGAGTLDRIASILQEHGMPVSEPAF